MMDMSKGLVGAPFDLDGVDELSARVFRAFLGTARLHVQLMMRTLQYSGKHPDQAMCLRMLSVNDGVSQRGLARVPHVARHTITLALEKQQEARA